MRLPLTFQQCKHILATRLANKLSLFMERPTTQDNSELMVRQQFYDSNVRMSVNGEGEVLEYNTG
jgi:hypothetical protein